VALFKAQVLGLRCMSFGPQARPRGVSIQEVLHPTPVHTSRAVFAVLTRSEASSFPAVGCIRQGSTLLSEFPDTSPTRPF
jgi:hypothetical protein